jgi:competence protein ComEA
MGSAASSSGGIGNGLISLNRASQVELEALPGVGPALAGRMVDWRTANGGFKKKEDLLNISGIGDKLYAGIKDEVTL